MGLTGFLYDQPFYGGQGVSAQVPSIYNVSLNGRNYLIDLNQPFYRQYKRQLSPLLRTQADTSTKPGEQSINPEDLWRRAIDDWSLGAGQRYLDRFDTGALPNQFWASKGINVWKKWELSLLPDTRRIRTSANTNLAFETAGSYLYVIDGNNLLFTSDVTVGSPTWTTVTGTPANAATSIHSDGFNIWVCYGTGGIWTTTRGAAAATQLVTTALDATAIVWFGKGRLMVGWKNAIYNVTSIAPAALPAALFTHNDTDLTWIDFTEGPNQIYAAGRSGDKSWIYGATVLTDGTALAPPVVQGELPDGEQITAIFGYLGYLVIGTSLGVRIGTLSTAGAVTIQSLIPTPNPVTAATGQDRFCFFGWTNFDATSTGIGRLDLQHFTVPGIQPAYASDLMVTAQGAVTDIHTFQNLRLIAVGTSGFWVQHANLVASGYIDSGYILYNLPDLKVATLVDVQSPVPLPAGAYTVALSADYGPFNAVGMHVAANADPVTFPAGQVSAQRFELRVTLTADAVLTTVSPTISRVTLRSWPAPRRPLTWQLPIMLFEELENASGANTGIDPLYELQALESLASNGQLVTFQEGPYSYPVFVSDVEFLPEKVTLNKRYFNGIALVNLKGLPVAL